MQMEVSMKRILFYFLTAGFIAVFFTSTYASKSEEKTRRDGNIETVESVKSGKIEFRIVYTYEGNRKIKGEYWEAVDPKDKGKKKPQSNILAGTPVAKHYETILAGSKTTDTSGIVIDIEKDGFVLKSVRTVKYNAAGFPEHIEFRGYTSYPVLGVFNLKTDWDYTYDPKGKLTGLVEKNMSLDSLLLNMAAENKTKIERDQDERPVKITRTIGSVPPVFETTEYTYEGSSSNMKKTVYRKCAFDSTKLKVAPSETITTMYGSNIPWEGMKKYDFTMSKTIAEFSVYDEVNKKQKLDGSGFMKKSFIDKGMYMKNLYDYYKNEQKGPKWRMGELPDIPEPFLIYKDNLWYK
jgi:hypothetical protein